MALAFLSVDFAVDTCDIKFISPGMEEGKFTIFFKAGDAHTVRCNPDEFWKAIKEADERERQMRDA